MEHRIPHESVGAVNFSKRAEIKDLAAHLRLLINLLEKTSFIRIINTPKRGIGKKPQAAVI